MRQIPLSEIVRDDARFAPGVLAPGVLAATRAFARSKPFSGTTEERQAKYTAFLESLVQATGAEPIGLLFHEVDRPTNRSGNGAILQDRQTGEKKLMLAYRLSALTLLVLFAAHQGLDEIAARSWAYSLFKRCFPRSYAALRYDPVSGMLSRDLTLLN